MSLQKQALDLYLYMGSHKEIIKWLEEEGVETRKEALSKLRPLVGSSVGAVAGAIGRGEGARVSLSGTAGCVKKVLEHFPEDGETISHFEAFEKAGIPVPENGVVIIQGGRRSGKTSFLMDVSAKTKAILVTQGRVPYLEKLAHEKNLRIDTKDGEDGDTNWIPMPISYLQFLARMRDSHGRAEGETAYLIDNMEIFSGYVTSRDLSAREGESEEDFMTRIFPDVIGYSKSGLQSDAERIS